MDAYKSGDLEQTFRCAHTFKGICLNLALINIYVHADIITEHFRPDSVKLCDNIDEEFAKLEEEYNKTVE